MPLQASAAMNVSCRGRLALRQSGRMPAFVATSAHFRDSRAMSEVKSYELPPTMFPSWPPVLICASLAGLRFWQ